MLQIYRVGQLSVWRVHIAYFGLHCRRHLGPEPPYACLNYSNCLGPRLPSFNDFIEVYVHELYIFELQNCMGPGPPYSAVISAQSLSVIFILGKLFLFIFKLAICIHFIAKYNNANVYDARYLQHMPFFY